MRLVGYRNAGLIHYLNFSKNWANRFIPSGQDPYIESVNYTFDSGNRNLNVELTWNYCLSGEAFPDIA